MTNLRAQLYYERGRLQTFIDILNETQKELSEELLPLYFAAVMRLKKIEKEERKSRENTRK